MQIESLWTFNEKFQPEWHPRYAAYDSPEHLLSASIAVARAESFFEIPIIGRFFKPAADEPARAAAAAAGRAGRGREGGVQAAPARADRAARRRVTDYV